MSLSIVPATDAHVMHVALHMRQADVDEVYASSGVDPLTALQRSVKFSEEVWCGLAGEEPFCIFGVGPQTLLSGIGVPWLLGTEGVEKHAHGFLVRSKRVMRRWREQYPVLENWVDARNTQSIRWLEWLGFELEPAVPHGFLGLPFHPFSLRRVEHV